MTDACGVRGYVEVGQEAPILAYSDTVIFVEVAPARDRIRINPMV